MSFELPITAISRAEAKSAGLTRYFTGKPCPYGHIAERQTSNKTCISCLKISRFRRRLGTLDARKKENRRRRISRRNTPEKRKIDGHKMYMRQRATPEKRRAHNAYIRANAGPIVLALRNRLRIALRGNAKVGSAVRDLGCTIEEFKDYIAEKFLPGMSWDNYGRNTWHLDHIRPLVSFDLTDCEQFLVAVHYTNYQPLWAVDNARKGSKYPAAQ